MPRAPGGSNQLRLGSRVQLRDDEKQDDGADDRQDETGRVEERAVLGLGENPGNQAADDRAADADKGGEPKPHLKSHEGFRDESNDESDDDRPDDVEHDLSFRGAPPGCQCRRNGEGRGQTGFMRSSLL